MKIVLQVDKRSHQGTASVNMKRSMWNIMQSMRVERKVSKHAGKNR